MKSKQAHSNLFDEPEFMVWFNERPELVQAMIRKHPPGAPYTLSSGPWPTFIVSYAEDGTVRVQIEDPKFPREVFGVDPDGLTPMSDEACLLLTALGQDVVPATDEDWEQMRVNVLKARGIYHDDKTTQ